MFALRDRSCLINLLYHVGRYVGYGYRGHSFDTYHHFLVVVYPQYFTFHTLEYAAFYSDSLTWFGCEVGVFQIEKLFFPVGCYFNEVFHLFLRHHQRFLLRFVHEVAHWCRFFHFCFQCLYYCSACVYEYKVVYYWYFYRFPLSFDLLFGPLHRDVAFDSQIVQYGFQFHLSGIGHSHREPVYVVIVCLGFGHNLGTSLALGTTIPVRHLGR